MDMGAYVIVLNAGEVTLTGRKTEKKTYFRHVNGRPGSGTTETFKDLQEVRQGVCMCVCVCGMHVCTCTW